METQEAFDVLLGELQAAMEIAQEGGTNAFQESRFTEAQTAAERAKVIKSHLTALKKLQEEWESVMYGTASPQPRPKKKKRTHLSPGFRTPQKAFRIPVLKALIELGGAAQVGKVLEIVEGMMSDQFNENDKAVLKDGRTPRWRNTAAWERQLVKEEGPLKPDSPRGVWEITEKGRANLQEHT